MVTEPYSSDDWEIIVCDGLLSVEICPYRFLPSHQELHASYVEQNLLSQVRAASIGQEVDVWIFGRTRARLRVGMILIPFHDSPYVSILVVSFAPAPEKQAAVLLGTDTEVSIAPKKRQSASEAARRALSAEKKDDSKPKILNSIKLRVLPHSFFSLPPNSNDFPEGPTAVVSIWTYRELSKREFPLELSEGFGPLNVYRLKMHNSDPLANEPAAPAPGAGSTSKQSAKVIHAPEDHLPNGTAKSVSEEEAAKTPETVTLRWSREVPVGHVVFLSYDGVRVWNNWSDNWSTSRNPVI